MTACLIIPYLFLPVGNIFLDGIPDVNKNTMAVAGLALGILLFDTNKINELSFNRWDFPILIWCFSPLFSSLSNDLGWWDGFSSVNEQLVVWGIPYMVGRLYFSETKALRELAVGIVIGGMIYIPFCLFEIRFSPQLHKILYGYHQHYFSQTVRFGGYRPMVFLSHGLVLGMWMSSATLIAYWLWKKNVVKQIAYIPIKWCFWALLLTTLACKSANALILLTAGFSLLLFCKTRLVYAIAAFILILPATYIVARSLYHVSADPLVEATKIVFNEDRAASLQTRFKNEEILSYKALQKPWLGWGGWGRSRVYDNRGRDISVTDGFWIISLGQYGFVGCFSMMAIFLLPMFVLLMRFPPMIWARRFLAPAAAMAVLLVLLMINNLANSTAMPMYIMAAGALLGLRKNAEVLFLRDTSTLVARTRFL